MVAPASERPSQVPPTNNETEPSQNTQSGFSRRQKIIAGIAGATVLGGGAMFGIYKGAESGSQKAIENIASGDATVSAPEVPGVEGVENEIDYSKIDVQTLTVDQFYDDNVYPQEYRIKWANEIIKEREQQAYIDLNQILTDHGHPPLEPLVAPAVDNIGNEITVQHDVIQFIASSDPNPDEGKKLLAAVADTNAADDVFDTIGKDRIVSFHRVPSDSETGKTMESPVFSKVAIGDYTPNGTPSKIYVTMNGITGEASENIVRFVGGRYIIHNKMNSKDSSWIKYPEQIADK